tara:strand:+ start:188 stop:463 length:276 start_codon:yes stop_codon:yes gene_type:complete
MTNINEIVSFITSCNDEDRKTIVDALNIQRRVANEVATKQLHIGARVKFTSSKGRGIIEGIVTKINKKSVKLDCEIHGKWTVSPNLLTLIK